MQINNKLIGESLAFTPDKKNMLVRTEEIGDLTEIDAYCADIKEYITIDDTIWDQEVEEGILLSEWMYSGSGEGSEDDRARMQEFINRNSVGTRVSPADAKEVKVSLGEYEDAVDNERQYIQKRRDILASISSVEEYREFMDSCFRNSCFADNILSEMKNIEKFSSHTQEITDCLGLLNDEALKLYEEHRDNLKEAMAILTAKQIKCSPDHAHRDSLIFPFTYYEEIEGEKCSVQKEIMCEPHLKLINKHSNLRIYFYWKDDQVGEGRKVLVGRIGRHPY